VNESSRLVFCFQVLITVSLGCLYHNLATVEGGIINDTDVSWRRS
jgi:hypothetical protein